MVVKRSLIKDISEDRVLLLPQKKLGTMFGNANKNVLKLSQRVAYGLGHVMNDICAAMWFSYALLFFEVVLQMPSAFAGGMICVGQVADTIASPVIGVLVDRYGTRKSWHMLGTALIAFSFTLVFSKCPWGPDYPHRGINGTESDLGPSPWSTASTLDIILGLLYYLIIVTIFQTGWATVQIAHLAIIPDMTQDKVTRADLTGIRYTATVCASVFVYLVTWLVLHVAGRDTHSLGPQDLYKFQDVVLIGLLTGGIFTMLFHGLLDAQDDRKKLTGENKNWWEIIKEYLRSWPLYQVTLVYFSSRMILNISLIYMPLFLVENPTNSGEFIAIIPLASYIASFLASLGVRQVRSFVSSKTSYLFGTLMSIAASVWIGVGLSHTAEIFGAAILLGAGSSVTGVASLCICAEFIGTDTENGAFVYSVVTAVDKLLGGIAVILIENLKSWKIIQSTHYYRDVIAFGCGAFSVLGLISIFTMYLSSKRALQVLEKKLPESGRPD